MIEEKVLYKTNSNFVIVFINCLYTSDILKIILVYIVFELLIVKVWYKNTSISAFSENTVWLIDD